MSTARIKAFVATLERATNRPNWVIIHVPFDVGKTWGTRGQLRVKGDINGFAFRTSLFPGKRGHIMVVNKAMQAAANARPGSKARFRLAPDTAKRTVSVPRELIAAFSGDRALRRWFDNLNHSMRREIAKWITQPQTAAARHRRADQLAERLLATMEAERELPPLLQRAFAREPLAEEGWQAMSLARRRRHLLSIFYYRTPEGRERRLAQALEDAVALAKRRRR